jgi:hypothetical protein
MCGINEAGHILEDCKTPYLYGLHINMFFAKSLVFAAAAATVAHANPFAVRQTSTNTQFGTAILDPTTLSNGSVRRDCERPLF